MTRISVFLDRLMKQELDKISRLEDRPLARIIRQALEQFIDTYQPKKVKR